MRPINNHSVCNGCKIMSRLLREHFSEENKDLYSDENYKIAERRYIREVLEGRIKSPLFNILFPESSAKNF